MDSFNLWVISITLIFPFLAWRSIYLYRSLPTVDNRRIGDLPKLSFIVPARNEAHNLRRLLPSLQVIRYPGPVELIVVDDQSNDGTGAIAQEFGAKVIRIDDLPPGWLGKPHASHLGAQAATGEWLLFTDADTVHNPDGPAAVVAFAESKNLDGLSAFLKQHTRGWWDTITLIVAFSGLFSGLRRESSILNGQYILIKRDVYERSGGFNAIREEPLDDLAFGHLLSKHGFRIPIMNGESLAQVSMYRDWKQMWEGIIRLGSGSLRWSGLGSLISILFITCGVTPLLVLVFLVSDMVAPQWALLAWLLVIPGFLPWAKRYGSSWWALLAPLGALIVLSTSTFGLFRNAFGLGVSWKGRIVRRRTSKVVGQ